MLEVSGPPYKIDHFYCKIEPQSPTWKIDLWCHVHGSDLEECIPVMADKGATPYVSRLHSCPNAAFSRQ